MNENINIANFLSLSRVLACIPLILCFSRMNDFPEYRLYSIFVIIYIVLSDVLDGFYARKADVVTDLGKIIDPVADKIAFITVLIYLIQSFGQSFFIFFILISIRDIILLAFGLYFIIYTDYTPHANASGKLFIFICVLMIIFYIYNLNQFIAYFLYLSSIVLLFFSSFVYIKNHLKKIKKYENIQ